MHTLCNLFSTFPCWSWTMTLQKHKIKRNWVDGFVFSSFYATDHWFEWKEKMMSRTTKNKTRSDPFSEWAEISFFSCAKSNEYPRFPTAHNFNLMVYDEPFDLFMRTKFGISVCFFSIYKRVLNRYVSL